MSIRQYRKLMIKLCGKMFFHYCDPKSEMGNKNNLK